MHGYVCGFCRVIRNTRDRKIRGHELNVVNDFQAYISTCDLLIAFCKQLENNPLLRPLVYEPDRGLQQTLNDFIQTYVFVEDDDEEQDEHTKIEELHKRRNYLASFCKLVVYNVLPIKMAGDVFRHYVKYYNDYGDIIKTTLGKAREINKVSCARTMVLSLTMLFRDLHRDSGSRIDRQSEEFVGVKVSCFILAVFFSYEQNYSLAVNLPGGMVPKESQLVVLVNRMITQFQEVSQMFNRKEGRTELCRLRAR